MKILCSMYTVCLKLYQNLGKLHHNHNSFKEYCEFVRSHRFSSLTETTGTGEDVNVDAMKVTVGKLDNRVRTWISLQSQALPGDHCDGSL
jgi:hypothetical protein